MTHRIDPPGCGCTDCLTGWSKPLDMCDDSERHALSRGSVQNATGIDWGGDATASVTRDQDPGDLRLSGSRDVELRVQWRGPTAGIGVDWPTGEAWGEFHGDELLRLRDWITETYG